MALNMAVTTYKLPLQIVRKGDIEQYLTNPDTMSTLASDTLVNRVELPRFEWRDIIVE